MDKDFCWAESPTRHRKGKAGAEGGGNHDYLSRGNRGNSFDISDSCIFSEHQAFISKESCEQNSLWRGYWRARTRLRWGAKGTCLVDKISGGTKKLSYTNKGSNILMWRATEFASLPHLCFGCYSFGHCDPTISGVTPQGHKQQGRALAHQSLPSCWRGWKPAAGAQELGTAQTHLKGHISLRGGTLSAKSPLYLYYQGNEFINFILLQFFRRLFIHSTGIDLSVFQWSYVITVTAIYLISLPLM